MVTSEEPTGDEAFEPPSPVGASLLEKPVVHTRGGLVLPAEVQQEEALGAPGRPFSRRTPFYYGFFGAIGVGLAYILLRALSDISSILLAIGVSLFLAIGLEPAVAFLNKRGIRRGLSVLIIIIAFLLVIGGFIAAAVPPIAHEAQTLSQDYPKYRSQILHGHGWLGRLVKQFHLTSYLKGKKAAKLKVSIEGGALGAGKVLLTAVTSTIIVIVLTIYFLIALPAVKRMWLGLVPLSRRERAQALTEETFAKVGGFVLGNLLTSVVSGLGTYVWLMIFGVPYPFLLALFVALLDLIPIVGSTIGGVIVSLVALVKGLPVALATAAFYIAYRFFEDYLLTPRVMGHTVKISPGLTIIATLIGGSLLGLIGALIAIPVAATIYLLIEEVVYPHFNRG